MDINNSGFGFGGPMFEMDSPFTRSNNLKINKLAINSVKTLIDMLSSARESEDFNELKRIFNTIITDEFNKNPHGYFITQVYQPDEKTMDLVVETSFPFYDNLDNNNTLSTEVKKSMKSLLEHIFGYLILDKSKRVMSPQKWTKYMLERAKVIEVGLSNGVRI